MDSIVTHQKMSISHHESIPWPTRNIKHDPFHDSFHDPFHDSLQKHSMNHCNSHLVLKDLSKKVILYVKTLQLRGFWCKTVSSIYQVNFDATLFPVYIKFFGHEMASVLHQKPRLSRLRWSRPRCIYKWRSLCWPACVSRRQPINTINKYHTKCLEYFFFLKARVDWLQEIWKDGLYKVELDMKLDLKGNIFNETF